MSPKAHQRYIQSLENLSIGDPMYHPDSEGLKLGHCGYFDNNGRWRDIFDIMTIDSDHSKYKPLAELPVASMSEAQRWGPIFGSSVKSCGIEEDTSVAIPGVPGLTAGVSLKFAKKSGYGAVLMADPVTYEAFPHKEPFHKWCKDNAPKLLADETFGPELKRRNFFIITELYTTNRCSITQWDGREKEMCIGVSAEAWSMGKLTGGGFWGKSTNIGSWRGFGFDEELKQASRPPKKLIMTRTANLEAAEQGYVCGWVGV
ncbi:hypothetical protein AWENTII_010336 [Aspergillus wentii]